MRHNWETSYEQMSKFEKQNVIIPNDRRYYLREIIRTVRGYHQKAEEQVNIARNYSSLKEQLKQSRKSRNDALVASLDSLAKGEYRRRS